jgi:hypothetical protein
MKRFVIFMITGALQTLIAHSFGLHRGLEHMQYGDSWGWYIFESLFYSFIHLIIYRWSKNK